MRTRDLNKQVPHIQCWRDPRTGAVALGNIINTLFVGAGRERIWRQLQGGNIQCGFPVYRGEGRSNLCGGGGLNTHTPMLIVQNKDKQILLVHEHHADALASEGLHQVGDLNSKHLREVINFFSNIAVIVMSARLARKMEAVA